jgi:hypothetical protein
VAAALLVGCAGTPTQTSLPVGSATHKASGSGGDLLYVTTSSGIAIVSYPKWQIVGTIPGTSDGEICSDPNSGTVYAVEPYLAQIVVYEHGGTTPINTLSAPSPYDEIYSCSVDAASGDLAAIGYDSSANEGALLFYAKGQGAATIYKSKKIRVIYSAAYVSGGNLILEASTKNGSHMMKFSAKKKNFSFLRTYGDFYMAGLQWDGRYLATLNYNFPNGPDSTLYQIDVSGNMARVVNTTTIRNTINNNNFCVAGASLIGFFGRLKRNNNQALAAWPYPAGGRASSRFYGVAKGDDHAYGLTLSVDSSHK